MTHEGEELQHDISKLRDQMQQISHSQTATKDDMDSLKEEIKGDMDGFKGDIYGLKGNMNGLKGDMEGLKECLTNLFQERLPGGDKVIHENHDEDKRNMNYDCRDSNVGLKNQHIPNIDMISLMARIQ